VDMARMKIEVTAHHVRQHGVGRRDRLVAYLPRYAPWAHRMRAFLHARERLPGAARLGEHLTGFSARRSLPRWHARPWRGPSELPQTGEGPPVVLFADTFTTWFEPENARA